MDWLKILHCWTPFFQIHCQRRSTKTLLLLNTPAKDESKIHVSNESDFSLMNKVLPIEILKKILEKLDFRSVCLARQTCKYWNEIICKLKVAEKVSSKFVEYHDFV